MIWIRFFSAIKTQIKQHDANLMKQTGILLNNFSHYHTLK